MIIKLYTFTILAIKIMIIMVRILDHQIILLLEIRMTTLRLMMTIQWLFIVSRFSRLGLKVNTLGLNLILIDSYY